MYYIILVLTFSQIFIHPSIGAENPLQSFFQALKNWFQNIQTALNPTSRSTTSGNTCSGVGEVYKDCGTCERTCTELNPICTKECKVGCFCAEGLVRDNTRNRSCINQNSAECVAQRNSTKTSNSCSGVGEVYKECGGCDGSCTEPNPMCTMNCRVGCFCGDGFVRDNTRNGICVNLNSAECVAQRNSTQT